MREFTLVIPNPASAGGPVVIWFPFQFPVPAFCPGSPSIRACLVFFFMDTWGITEVQLFSLSALMCRLALHFSLLLLKIVFGCAGRMDPFPFYVAPSFLLLQKQPDQPFFCYPAPFLTRSCGVLLGFSSFLWLGVPPFPTGSFLFPPRRCRFQTFLSVVVFCFRRCFCWPIRLPFPALSQMCTAFP